MYLQVTVGQKPVTALLDSGSSINVVSRELYDTCRSSFSDESPCPEKVLLANNQNVQIFGSAYLRLTVGAGNKGGLSQKVQVYILNEASHPIILGTQYMRDHEIVLDFRKQSLFHNMKRSAKVKCRETTVIQPHSEIIMQGELPAQIPLGTQGVCVGHFELLNKGLFLAKSLVTCSAKHCVAVRVLNPTNEPIYVNKNSVLASFKLCDNSYDVYYMSCANMCVQDDKVVRDTNEPDLLKFKSSFNYEKHPDMSKADVDKLFQCLYDFRDVFATNDNADLGCTDMISHKIHLKPDFVPKYQRPYRLPPDKKAVLRHQLDELLRQGIICPVSDSEDVPITSPIVLVAKRNKPKLHPDEITKESSLSSYRFCCDFRYLNKQTADFNYAIPDLEDLTESFSHVTPNFITSLDLSSGFFQMAIDKDSSRYTAFNTCYGTFKFLRLPMGLKTSPNSFQLLIDTVMKGLTFKTVLCYIDDICVLSETLEQHLADLSEVFQRLREAGLKLGPNKCKFAQSSCVFLGHKISKDGIEPPPSQIEVLRDYPEPTSRKELQRAIGLLNWFRKFIPNYSVLAFPLHKLMRKDASFIWSKECSESFRRLKDAVINSDVLAFPRYDLEFRVAVDTSSKGIGYVLYQIHENGEKRVIRFGSKGLKRWQQSYGPTKLELLGVITSVLDLSSYVRGRHFTIECDHQALKALFQKQFKGAIYERWMAILQSYDFDFQHKPASEMCVPDALSRLPDFPQEISSSPEEEDPYFRYIPERPMKARLIGSDNKVNQVFHPLNRMQLHTRTGDPVLAYEAIGYDADTEANDIGPFHAKQGRSGRFRRQLAKNGPRSHRDQFGLRRVTRPRDSQNPRASHDKTSEGQLIANHDKTVVPLTIPEHFDSTTEIQKSATDSSSATTELPSVSDAPQAHRDPISATDSSSAATESRSVSDAPQAHRDPISATDSSSAATESRSVSDATQAHRDPISATDSSSAATESRSVSDAPQAHRDPISATDSSAATESDSVSETSQVVDHGAQAHDLSRPADSGSADYGNFTQIINLTKTELIALQQKDVYCSDLIKYLTDGTLPKSQKLARKVLLEHSDFLLVDNLLFHCRVQKSKRARHMKKFQLVLPKTIIQTVLEHYHDSAMAGHGGIADTLDRIRENFYFPLMNTLVADYIKSCHQCQTRKISKIHNRNAIVSYPTPSAPFDVWEIDLYGPLPRTSRGNLYIFTAVDVFSRFLVCIPVASKDAISISEAIYTMFTSFGVCDTLISDQGSEFTANVTQELCKRISVNQQFTPSFVHHCLGLCERSHGTLAVKLTPYMTQDCTNWESVLPSIVFAMNNAANSATGYSPFEIVFSRRPKFPLNIAAAADTPNTSLPRDVDSYLASKFELMKEIHSGVVDNISQSQDKMLLTANAKKYLKDFEAGDYVYLQHEACGNARKLRAIYEGPYIIRQCYSPHMVILADPAGKKSFPLPIHIDRIKNAHIRQPTPDNFFTVTTKRAYCDVSVQTEDKIAPDTADNESEDGPCVTANNPPDTADRPRDTAQNHRDIPAQNHRDIPAQNLRDITAQNPRDTAEIPRDTAENPRDNVDNSRAHSPAILRPRRLVQKPIRYRDESHINPDDIVTDVAQVKVKRILAQRNSDTIEYLVQLVGEPAQNAAWRKLDELDQKTRKLLKQRPPPLV